MSHFFEVLPSNQQEQAQRIYQDLKEKADLELQRIAVLLASQEDHQLLADGEFQMRDHLHRIGAMALESVLQQRKKRDT